MLVKNRLPFNVTHVSTADILETMKGTFLTEIPQERPSSWGKTQESVFTTLLSFLVSFSKKFARKRNRFIHFHFDSFTILKNAEGLERKGAQSS